MADEMPNAGQLDDDLEVTDLRPGKMRPVQVTRRQLRFNNPDSGRVMLVLSILLLFAVLLRASPLWSLVDRFTDRSSSGSTTAVGSTSISISLSTPAGSDAQPTALPGNGGVPPLGMAPANCSTSAPSQTQAGPPTLGYAVGYHGVWIDGFSGAYPTLSLRGDGIGAESNAPFGWPLHYTQYGWPAPIALVIGKDVTGPVTLTGWNPIDSHPLWFGILDGVSSVPPVAAPSFTIDPAHPAILPGGTEAGDTFWYGYIFLPTAGCFALAANVSPVGWSVMVSAGQ